MKAMPFVATLLWYLALSVAEAKVALVIGNDAYNSKMFPSLDKSVSDAHTVAEKLRGLGYTVIEEKDLTLAHMEDKLRKFHDALASDRDVGVFYYAGHGVQIDEVNYLIPVGVNIERQYEAAERALPMSAVLNHMLTAQAGVNILILDACRDNNLPKRGGKVGLATMSAKDTFILFSTQKDETANDGTFVEHLKDWLGKPNLTIDEIARKVRDDVRDATHREQIPSYVNNLSSDFYFAKEETLNENILSSSQQLNETPSNTTEQSLSKKYIISDNGNASDPALINCHITGVNQVAYCDDGTSIPVFTNQTNNRLNDGEVQHGRGWVETLDSYNYTIPQNPTSFTPDGRMCQTFGGQTQCY